MTIKTVKWLIKRKFSTKLDYFHDTRDFLNKVKLYEDKLNDKLTQFELFEGPIKGHANPECTLHYSLRDTKQVHKQNFRSHYKSKLIGSSLGIGTYIGDTDDLTDYYMYNAIKEAVMSNGINFIDTGIFTFKASQP